MGAFIGDAAGFGGAGAEGGGGTRAQHEVIGLGGELVVDDAAPGGDHVDDAVVFGGGGDAVAVQVKIAEDHEVELAVAILGIKQVGDQIAFINVLIFLEVGDAAEGFVLADFDDFDAALAAGGGIGLGVDVGFGLEFHADAGIMDGEGQLPSVMRSARPRLM